MQHCVVLTASCLRVCAPRIEVRTSLVEPVQPRTDVSPDQARRSVRWEHRRARLRSGSRSAGAARARPSTGRTSSGSTVVEDSIALAAGTRSAETTDLERTVSGAAPLRLECSEKHPDRPVFLRCPPPGRIRQTAIAGSKFASVGFRARGLETGSSEKRTTGSQQATREPPRGGRQSLVRLALCSRGHQTPPSADSITVPRSEHRNFENYHTIALR
jgi:hypothetical protein